jgi:hypothetical protein
MGPINYGSGRIIEEVSGSMTHDLKHKAHQFKTQIVSHLRNTASMKSEGGPKRLLYSIVEVQRAEDEEKLGGRRREQCCGSGSGIRCLFDPWTRIRDPE